MKQRSSRPGQQRQRGAVVLVFGLTLVILIAFAGVALDLGRFFVVKTELQNAVDACALAAASQLNNDSNAVTRALAYGRVFSTGGTGNIAAIKNKANFQSRVLDPDVLEITFGTSNGPNDNSNYKSATDADPKAVQFVKCNYPLSGLPIYFMQVLNLLGLGPFTTQTVSAMAVATREAPLASCIPVAACAAAGGSAANNFGYNVGDWITAYDGTPYITGHFGWIDFNPPAGGAAEVKAILAGNKQCNIAQIGDPVGQNGNLDTLQEAWNSRFGLYWNDDGTGGHYTTAEAPPDKTGFAYSNTKADGTAGGGNWPSGANAYFGSSSVPGQLNFVEARAVNRPYQPVNNPALSVPIGIDVHQFKYIIDSATDLNTLGRADRRLVAAPVVNCGVWNSSPGQSSPILGWACVLMLSPIGHALPHYSEAGSDTAKLEFLGLASGNGNPCSGGAAYTVAPVLTQ